MSFSCCHVLLFHGSNTRICFDVTAILRDLSYRIYPPRKYSEGVHCTLYSTLYSTVYSNISTVSQNVKDQHNIPLSGISISFKYFLTNDKDSVVDCSTLEMRHSNWELCCQGDPAPIWPIKHLGGVQHFCRMNVASSDYYRLEGSLKVFQRVCKF